MDVRPTLKEFTEIVERQLSDHDYKGGWENCRPEALMDRLWGELGELQVEVYRLDYHALDQTDVGESRRLATLSNIRNEAADVAAVAMMVADAAGGLDHGPRTNGRNQP